jgi:hypothetical protein
MRVIVVARKPLEGTVAENVSKYGCGAINVDGCRIGPGRWPANLILQGYAVVTEIGNQSGWQKDGVAVQRHGGGQHIGGRHGKYGGANWDSDRAVEDSGYGGGGTAARFFKQIDVDSKTPDDGEVDP